ncbi:MAG: hemolysin family protein [Phycisphaerae bacterium]
MDVAFGLVLVGLTLYTSTLSYALRGFSRARLSAYLSDEAQRLWLERLDRREFEFQVVTSFIRLASILAMMAWVYGGYLVGRGAPIGWTNLVAPTLVNLLALVIVAIGIPHALAMHAGEAILARSLWPLWAVRYAFYPIEKTLGLTEFLVRRLLGKAARSVEEEAERMEQEILDAVSEGELHGAVDEEQKEIIKSVFELHDTHVSEIMTPRTDIVALTTDASYDKVRETIMRAGHSRIPVCEESLDRIVGVLYAKDLIRLPDANGFDVRKMMRTVPFVPETKAIDQLLRQLRQEKVHIAIVLDEYGGTAGLVTIEDILEELVGEIDDEYDREAPPEMKPIDKDTLEVDARVHVDEVNEALDLEIPDDDDYDTIGGFVFTTLGKIPDKGEEFTHGNVHFVVMDAEPRKINRLRIHVQREQRLA